MKLRFYEPADRAETIAVFEKAFGDSEGAEEGAVIRELVIDVLETTQPRDLYGFVTSEGDRIVAAILFTRLSFSSSIEAFILSPVAVHTDYHGLGIGQALIAHGLAVLKDDGVKLAFTYGDPNFYSKIGFQQISEEAIKAPLPLSQPHGWLCQTLDGTEIERINERPRCVSAFENPELW